MNTNAEQWLQALESGLYRQTTEGYLVDYTIEGDPSFCALGVAAYEFHLPSSGVLAYPSIKMCLGLTDWGFMHLLKLNDDVKLSFPEIAREVRKRPGMYFRK